MPLCSDVVGNVLGFRPRRSTEEQIAAMAQRTADCRAWKAKSAALFADFSAAYDNVVIPALLYKLAKSNANNTLVAWFKSYLTDRRARGRRLNCVDRSFVLGCGLPQGGSPSPLLWNIYTFDMDFSIPDDHCTGINVCQMGFADDTSFHAIGSSWTEVFTLLQVVATKLEQYCQKWRIQLNPKKCQLLCFGRKRPYQKELAIHINEVQIEETHFISLPGRVVRLLPHFS